MIQPMTDTVPVSGKQAISLHPLRLDDLPRLCRWFESIADKVEWAAFDDMEPAPAALKILGAFPSLATDVCAWITGLSPDTVKEWPLLDIINVLDKWLEINQFDALVREGGFFFARVTSLLETFAGPSNTGGLKT